MPASRIAALLLTLATAVTVVSCSSLSGKVDHAVYSPPDASFEVRLPEGVKRSGINEQAGGTGGQVRIAGKGKQSWQIQRCGKNAHFLSRADPSLPLPTRLLFAESAWAELTGMVARPTLGRDIVTMKDGRQAVLGVRRLGISNLSGLRGVLIFETEHYLWLLEFEDPALGDSDVATARHQLTNLYQGLTVHNG